jgi:Family of unknown function (DUF5652)
VHSAGVAGQKWEDLSAGRRRLVIGVTALDVSLKIAALVDLARRPAVQVRGPKSRWALAITLINSGGAVPIVYLLRGRRKEGTT